MLQTRWKYKNNSEFKKLFGYYGYKRIEIEEAEAGDFIAIAGLADISVGETICEVGKEKALPILHIR